MEQELQSKFSNLIKWIIENGGFVHNKIAIKYDSSENRFLYASEKIDKNELLIKIPEKCVINGNKIKMVPKGDLINASDEMCRLITLLYETYVQKDKSFFYPYISLLPTSFKYHPMKQFDETRIETYNNISKNITTKISELINNFKKIVKELIDINKTINILPEDVLNIENIEWGYLVLHTRQWTDGLFPVADLFQHSESSSMYLNTIKDNIGNEFKGMILQNDINTNDIIYDNYGVKDDIILFITYGFIDNPDNNKFRNFGLDLSVKGNASIPIELFKKVLLEQYIMNNKRYFITNDGFSNTLIELFRIISIDNNDIKLIDLTNKDFYKMQISLDNEKRTFDLIQNILKERIEEMRLTTSFSSDIMRFYGKETLEYKMAFLHMQMFNTYKKGILIITEMWNSKIGHLYNTKIEVNID